MSTPTRQTTTRRKVPPHALRAAAEFRLAAAEPTAEPAAAPTPQTPVLIPVELLARTAAVIDHWFWDRVAHDLEGVELPKDHIPIDCNHDRNPIGYLDTFRVTPEGLVGSGALVSTAPGDAAATLAARAKAGVPFEASIFFDSDASLVEDVPEGRTAAVNGQTVAGPVTIFRQWPLKSVSITQHGADPGTRAEFFSAPAPGEPALVSLAVTLADPPPAALAAPRAGSPEQCPGETSGDAAPPGRDDAAAMRADLARFVAAFGAAMGAQLFADAIPWEEALQRHNASLRAQLDQREAELAELRELQAQGFDRGEPAPVSLSDSTVSRPPAPDRFAHLPPNIARAARATKLPARKK